MRRNTERSTYFNDLAIKSQAKEEEEKRILDEKKRKDEQYKADLKQATLNMRQMLIDRKNKSNMGIDDLVADRIKREQTITMYEKIIADYFTVISDKNKQLDDVFKNRLNEMKQEADDLLLKVNKPEVYAFIEDTEKTKIDDIRRTSITSTNDIAENSIMDKNLQNVSKNDKSSNIPIIDTRDDNLYISPEITNDLDNPIQIEKKKQKSNTNKSPSIQPKKQSLKSNKPIIISRPTVIRNKRWT